MSNEIVRAAEGLSDQTYHVMIRLWIDNFRRNLPRIWKEPSIVDLPKKKDEPCLLLGAGPSIEKYKHLDMIAKTKWKHPILSCDRIFISALKHGLEPYTVASVDGSPLVAKYYNSPLIKQINTKAVFATTIHPEVTKKWRHQIYWFVPMLDSVNKLQDESKTYLLCIIAKHQGTMSGVGNVGSFNWNLAAELGCSSIILVGYDFSEQVKYKEQAIYWNHFVTLFLKKTNNLKEAEKKAATVHQVEKNPDFGTYYLVNPIWKGYREQLAAHIVTSKIHTINATGLGCLHTEAKNEKGDYILKCPNFEAMPLAQVLKEYN